MQDLARLNEARPSLLQPTSYQTITYSHHNTPPTYPSTLNCSTRNYFTRRIQTRKYLIITSWNNSGHVRRNKTL